MAATAASIVGGPHREWDRLVAEFRHADAAQRAAEEPHNVAETAYFAECKLLGDRPKSPDADYLRSIRDMTIGELRNYTAPADKHAKCLSKYYDPATLSHQRFMD